MLSKIKEIIKGETEFNVNEVQGFKGVRGCPLNVNEVQGFKGDRGCPPIFQLPISYIHDKYLIQKNIKSDLELSGGDSTIYDDVFNPSTEYAKKIIPMWSEYYTTNIPFLNDTKKFIKIFQPIDQPININKVDNILTELKSETGFYEKYKYIDSKYFEFLNNNPLFLQSLTIYNLISPILSLAIPILMLILPFFIIKFQSKSITISQYINALIIVLKYHVVGKAISEFADVGWDRKVFIIMSVVFYFINIYQNTISCYTFYKNIYKIRDYLLSISNFLSYSIKSITNINNYCKPSYVGFIKKNEEIKETLDNFNSDILSINLQHISIKQVGKIGNILQSFYQLFKNKVYQEAIDYSLHLQGYIENITQLQVNIKNSNMNYCTYTTRSSRFKGSYFAPLVNQKPVKNTYKLTKNIIITGPNAAGKTTMLKTTLFNIILSQQIGSGFYKSAIINPYRYIHSYINIPDTSERDSLFQAEARRCKEILDVVSESNNLERHFCIFDEIYSGTNPTEAIASAFGFLKYISKLSNLDYMLTTHYTSLCIMMDKVPNTNNKQMEIIDTNSTYKLINGISKIKGGIKVLEELSYSEEIINSAKEIVHTINF